MTYTFGLGGQVITNLLPPEDRSPTFKDHCDALLADAARIEKLEAKVLRLEAENSRLRRAERDVEWYGHGYYDE